MDYKNCKCNSQSGHCNNGKCNNKSKDKSCQPCNGEKHSGSKPSKENKNPSTRNQ